MKRSLWGDFIDFPINSGHPKSLSLFPKPPTKITTTSIPTVLVAKENYYKSAVSLTCWWICVWLLNKEVAAGTVNFTPHKNNNNN